MGPSLFSVLRISFRPRFTLPENNDASVLHRSYRYHFEKRYAYDVTSVVFASTDAILTSVHDYPVRNELILGLPICVRPPRLLQSRWLGLWITNGDPHIVGWIKSKLIFLAEWERQVPDDQPIKSPDTLIVLTDDVISPTSLILTQKITNIDWLIKVFRFVPAIMVLAIWDDRHGTASLWPSPRSPRQEVKFHDFQTL